MHRPCVALSQCCRFSFLSLACAWCAVEKYYQAMEAHDPQWKRPSKKSGRGKKRAASDEDDGSSPGSDSSDEESASRPSFVSERPKRQLHARMSCFASAQDRAIALNTHFGLGDNLL